MSLYLRATDLHEKMNMMKQEIIGVLGRYLQDSNAGSARAAADAIDRLTHMKCFAGMGGSNADDLETFLWQLWDIVIQGARKIPHDDPLQDRLVELVRTLAELPPVTVEIWQSETRLWTDLPLLGPSMREAWISPTYDNHIPTSEEATEWINLNAFAARLLNLGTNSWALFALWELRAALEEPCDGLALECNVAVATEWIIHAGKPLYASAVTIEEDNDHSKAANGPFYEGNDMLCLERWRFWKWRFGELGEQLEANTKQMALETRERMEAIEQSHGG